MSTFFSTTFSSTTFFRRHRLLVDIHYVDIHNVDIAVWSTIFSTTLPFRRHRRFDDILNVDILFDDIRSILRQARLCDTHFYDKRGATPRTTVWPINRGGLAKAAAIYFLVFSRTTVIFTGLSLNGERGAVPRTTVWALFFFFFYDGLG